MVSNTIHQIKLYNQLAKVPLCLMVACSTAFGYLLTSPTFTLHFTYSFFGVFFLACGAASFNSIQEKDTDANYKRTCHRPVAMGTISSYHATIFSCICCGAGLLLLTFSGDNMLPFFLGLLALIIYNLVYTPLKTKSEFALIPGGLSGALPPYIGWISAGGAAFHPLIWAVMALFFLWQPPHFCLILLEYADDYRNKRSFHNLITKLSKKRVKRIIAVWLLAFLSTILLFTTLPEFLSTTARFTLAVGATIFVTLFLVHLFLSKSPKYKVLFISLNGFLLSIMTLLTFSSLSNSL